MGEGAGYAGGIVSAAVDGMNAAQSIVAEITGGAARGGRENTREYERLREQAEELGENPY